MKKVYLFVTLLLVTLCLKAQIVIMPGMQGVQYSGAPIKITTAAITNNTTGNSASSGASITNPRGMTITDMGICWSTASNPTVALATKSNNGSTSSTSASFTYTMTGLTSGTTYYVRGYATVSGTTYYGNEVVFATALVSTFSYTGSLQSFTVPAGVTSITINAYGAEGGTSTGESGGRSFPGGRGASMQGTFAVSPGQQLTILVGGQGTNSGVPCSTGGGGGSWVVRGASELLLVAGGGGGGFHCNYYGGANGGPGLTSTSGGNGILASGGINPNSNTVRAGGSSGNGGSAYYGGGGGGWLSGGTATVNSNQAGNRYPGAASAAGGGYGGGGGGYAGSCCGSSGGGGGYSGGSSGNNDGTSGGGGGSFNSGASQVNTQGGGQAGHGRVVINW